MKYIRTKNEVIDLTKLPNLDINDRGDITWYDDAEKYGHMIDYEDIIKVADSIEELCDIFIILPNDSKRVCIEYHFKNLEATNYAEVFGAIKTSKGLICVAKMNEKGELELL